MKLLIITPYCIYPAQSGGQIRIFELARGISASNIHVTAAMPVTPQCYSRRQVNSHLTFSIIYYPFVLPYFLTNKPFSYNYWLTFHPGYWILLRRLIRNHDIIQFEGVSFGDLAGKIPKEKIVVYDAHNVEADYESGESRGQWARSISVKRIKSLEEKLARQSDCILTCSQENSDRLADLYQIALDKCVVIPNGIHVDHNHAPLSNEEVQEKFPAFFSFQQRAIFTGSDVAHNREAVRFIVESLAPELRKTCAFLFKGQCGNRFRHHTATNLFFDPEPGHVGHYADACTVALNPVTLGSGTSLKVLDYLAHQIPVLSTHFGMRGFEDIRPIVTISDLADFGKHLKTDLNYHPHTKERIENYAWKLIAGRLSNIYHSLLEGRES